MISSLNLNQSSAINVIGIEHSNMTYGRGESYRANDSAVFLCPFSGVITRMSNGESLKALSRRALSRGVFKPRNLRRLNRSLIPVCHTNLGVNDMTLLSINDLNTEINHEPRVEDLLVAEKLGYENPRQIRELIKRNQEELKAYASLSHRTTNTKSGGRPAKTYYLSEGQALVICALSRTPKAAEVRKAIIEVFMAWRKGSLPQVQPHVDVSLKEKRAKVREVIREAEEIRNRREELRRDTQDNVDRAYCRINAAKMHIKQTGNPYWQEIMGDHLKAAEEAISKIQGNVFNGAVK